MGLGRRHYVINLICLELCRIPSVIVNRVIIALLTVYRHWTHGIEVKGPVGSSFGIIDSAISHNRHDIHNSHVGPFVGRYIVDGQSVVHGPLALILLIIDQDSDFIGPVNTTIRGTILLFQTNQLVIAYPEIFMEITQIAVSSLGSKGILEGLSPLSAAAKSLGNAYQFTGPQTLIILDDSGGRILTGGDTHLFTGGKCIVFHGGAVISHCIVDYCIQFHFDVFILRNSTTESDIHILTVTGIGCGYSRIIRNGIWFVSYPYILLRLIYSHPLRQQINNNRIRKVNRLFLFSDIGYPKLVGNGRTQLHRFIGIRTTFIKLDLRCPRAVHLCHSSILSCLIHLRTRLTLISPWGVGQFHIGRIGNLLNLCDNTCLRFFLFVYSGHYLSGSCLEVLAQAVACVCLEVRRFIIHIERFDLLSIGSGGNYGDIPLGYIHRILFVFCAVEGHEGNGGIDGVILGRVYLIGVLVLPQVSVHPALAHDNLCDIVPFFCQGSLGGLWSEAGILQPVSIQGIIIAAVRCQGISQFRLIDGKTVNLNFIHLFCQSYLCISRVIFKDYFILVLIISLWNGDHLIEDNAGIIFHDAFIGTLLHPKIGFSGLDKLFIGVGGIHSIVFNKLCIILCQCFNLLLGQSFRCPIGDFIDFEAGIGYFDSFADILLLNNQLQVWNIIS